MMCARLLRNRPVADQGWFYRASERFFQTAIARYGTTLRWVLGRQTATLLVAGATLAATILLYVIVPKGFFPVQDTGVILGVSEAPQTVSFAAMAERQQELAKVILQDPAVQSLSSFIGVDGVNTTNNSGRIQINLKPLDARRASVGDVIRRLQQGPDALKDIYVHAASGAQVPLSAFTHFAPTTTALAVNHQGQFPAVTLSFNLAPGVALGDAVTAIEAAEREIGLPASIRAG